MGGTLATERRPGPVPGTTAPYDDFADMLARRPRGGDPEGWDDLVDRLAAWDVTHLAGGSAGAGLPPPYRGPADVDLPALLADLARSSSAIPSRRVPRGRRSTGSRRATRRG